MSTLGRLEPVELRQAWASEAGHFTPWLAQADNLKLLGESIGIELDLETTEKEVGPFRADILCKEVGSGHYVLIENQIERTDHTHLGQLLTYAAGLSAVTIVWIASRFTEEHRAALDWLNEVTGEGINFFGLEIELWRIGDSPFAPKFNVVCKPNAWTKSLEASRKEYSSNDQAYVPYWEALIELLKQRRSPVKPLVPGARYWLDMASYGNGTRWVAYAGRRDKYLMVCFYIGNDPEKVLFNKFLAHRDTVDAALPGLDWDAKPQYKSSSIDIRKRGVDPADESDWPSQHEWIIDNLERLHQVFAPLVKDL